MSLLARYILPAICVALIMGPPIKAEPKPVKQDDKKLPAGAVARLDLAGDQENGPVFSVVFSPNGKLLASGGQDGTMRLWDIATGKVVRRFKGHEKPVSSVAFSSGGKLLASGSQDKTVRLWDPTGGKQLHVLQGHADGVQAVALSPDGKTVASAGQDKLVRLWQTADGKELRRLKGHRRTIDALAFSPDGKLLVSAGRDRTARFWGLAEGKLLRLVRGPGWIFCVAFSADGKLLASGGLDQMIHLWEVDTGEGIEQFGGYEEPVRSVALARDGKMTAAGNEDHKVRLWENETGKVRRLFEGHRGPVFTVALSPDGKTLASAGKDAVILLWDVRGQRTKGRLPAKELTAKEREALWTGLGNLDAARAYQAMCRLTATPAQAVAALKERLQPILDLQVRVARLLADLDDKKYPVRRKAAVELEKLGELAVPFLHEALQGKPSIETRLRVEQLLRKVHRSDDESGFSSRLQLLRAIEVLEHIGTPEARKLLARLAQGLPTLWGKREAKAALERLGK
jgi:hypothetical protein